MLQRVVIVLTATLAAALVACGSEVPPTASDAAPPATDAGPVWQGDEARGPVVVNEVASAPGTGADWIELVNRGDAAFDLGGHYLSDAPDRLDHFYRFPAGTLLQPGERLIVWADDATAGEGHHAPFKLGREDGVVLLDADGVTLDALLYLGPTDGRTLARVPDGAGRFTAAVATPGAPNGEATP